MIYTQLTTREEFDKMRLVGESGVMHEISEHFRQKNCTTILAHNGKLICGFITTYKKNCIWIWVENESRGEGIGRKLVNLLQEHPRSKMLKAIISCENPASLVMFLKAGFKILPRMSRIRPGSFELTWSK